MTFRWPLRLKLTFDHQNNFFIQFLDPKKPFKRGIIYHFAIFHIFKLIYIYIANYFRPLDKKVQRIQTVATTCDFGTLLGFKEILWQFPRGDINFPRPRTISLCISGLIFYVQARTFAASVMGKYFNQIIGSG